MHQGSPAIPPHPQNNVQRSWSDEHIPVNTYSRGPIHHAPRSSSYSASRAPQPQCYTYPPPPPVPPLPPSLLHEFYGPPLTHANIALTFAESPRNPPLLQPWQPRLSSNLPSSSSEFTPRLLHQTADSAPPWPPNSQRNHFTPDSNFAPPHAAVPPPLPPPPPINYGYTRNTPNLGGSDPSFHALAQRFTRLEHQPSPPHVPPAVLPRPVSAHDEGKFERSSMMNLQAAPLPPPAVPPDVLPRPVGAPAEGRFKRSPTMRVQAAPLSLPHPVPPIVPPRPISAQGEGRFERSPTISVQASPSPSIAVPPVVLSRPVSARGEVRFNRSPTMSLQVSPCPPAIPPKTFSAPATPCEHIPTPSGQAIVSPSFDVQRISGTFLTRSLSSEPQVSEPVPLDSARKRAMTLSLQESHGKQAAVKTLEDEEDDELARALAESLSFSSPPEPNTVHVRKHLQTDTSYLTIVTQSSAERNGLLHHTQSSYGSWSETPSRRRPSFLNLGGIEILSPEELEDHAAHGLIIQALEDEQVTRQLQEEEEKRLAAELKERERGDEEVTRRLQEEEEKRLANELRERERADEERARMDAEFTKRLQEEEATRMEAEKREREQRDEAWGRLDAEIARRETAEEQARKVLREVQERNDAEMARWMAESDDNGRAHTPREMIRESMDRKDAEMTRRMVESNGIGQGYALQGPLPAHDPAFLSRGLGPPQYTDIVAASRRLARPPPRVVQSPPQVPNGSQPPTNHGHAASAFGTNHGHAASAFGSGPVQPAEQESHTRSAAMLFRGAGRRSDGGLKPEGTPPPSRDPSPGRGNSGRLSTSPSRTSASTGSVVAPEEDAIETDLLKSVSYGFSPPETNLTPSQPGTPFPEVISLFRAPSPPFHIMATSWRHLMRLLGRLETSIQANVEAIAQSKEEYLLRVVVQFVKLPDSENTWRTILHLTLDQTIPRDVQSAWKNQNKDTTTLPYSYTLGEPTPYLVNDMHSQFYVIPLSAATPILPITLPNLAMYLQSAMQDSRARKVQNDSSNGMRRLAKMVAECYPETDQEGRKPSRGVGNLFKRVVGLGGDREASQVNEDVYDIITPFRIDQYTAS